MQISRRSLIASAAVAAFVPRSAFADDLQGAQAYSASRNGVSVLVMERGQILVEDYANGGGPDVGWELASGTKSFCGILAAAMAHSGQLSLEERCADTLGEWRGDPRKSRITLHQLLTLTSGIGGGTLGRAPTYSDAVAAPCLFEPGSRFQYGPAPFQIFGELVRRKTGRDPLEVLRALILDPLSIRPRRWRRGADGYPHLPSGAALTARDWANFGRFVMAPRRGEPALHAATLAACFEGTAANPGYGLTWWLLRPGLIGPAGQRRAGLPSPEALARSQEDVRMAAGAGNQRLYLLPERGLVIVRQATGIMRSMRGRGSDWDDAAFLGFFL